MYKLLFSKTFILLSFISFLLMFFIVSCKITRKTTTPVVEQQPPKVVVKPEYKIQQPDYNWFSSRIDATVINTATNKEMVKLAVFMVNRKDSILYVNASKMGIELARIVLTPDSIKFINHLNSTYYIGNYTAVYQLLRISLTFDMVQSLLLNRDFTDFENDFNVYKQNENTLLIDTNRKQNHSRLSINQSILLNENDRIIKNHIIHTYTSDTLTANYSDFFNVTTLYRTPKIIDINLQRQKMRLILSFKDAKINVPGPTYFKIPSKYTFILQK